jgi:hypothetical protein
VFQDGECWVGCEGYLIPSPYFFYFFLERMIWFYDNELPFLFVQAMDWYIEELKKKDTPFRKVIWDRG